MRKQTYTGRFSIALVHFVGIIALGRFFIVMNKPVIVMEVNRSIFATCVEQREEWMDSIRPWDPDIMLITCAVTIKCGNFHDSKSRKRMGPNLQSEFCSKLREEMKLDEKVPNVGCKRDIAVCTIVH
jgi:hypothetical protein